MGTILTGEGTSFLAPTAAVTRSYSPACQALVDPGFTGVCSVVKAPGGTIAAIVELRGKRYKAGAAIAAGEERDLVYRQLGQTWSLVLRRVPIAAGQAPSQLYVSDIMRNQDASAVFVEPVARSRYGRELDVVAGIGKVTLYRQLTVGFAIVGLSGGLTTYAREPAGGYTATSLRYGVALGGWKVLSVSHVTENQAKELASQAWTDPSGSQVSPPTSASASTTTTDPSSTPSSSSATSPSPTTPSAASGTPGTAGAPGASTTPGATTAKTPPRASPPTTGSA